MDPLTVMEHFYPEDTPLRRLLLKHSSQVRDKALRIAEKHPGADRELVSAGAMLHDIGIYLCSAPGILCTGTEPYLAHGVLGAKLLREYDPALEPYARICERHTGSGLTAEEILSQKLPLPAGDYLPETLEEKIICLADKFYSKSGDMKEKPLDRVRHSMEKFGPAVLARFDELCQLL